MNFRLYCFFKKITEVTCIDKNFDYLFFEEKEVHTWLANIVLCIIKERK